MRILLDVLAWGVCLLIIIGTAIAVIAIVLLGVAVALVLEIVRSILSALFAVSKNDDSGIGSALAEWYDTIRVIVVDVVRLAVDLGRGVVKRLSTLDD